MNCKDCDKSFAPHELRRDLCVDCILRRLDQCEAQNMNLLRDEAPEATELSDNAVDDARRELWRAWPYLRKDMAAWQDVPPEPVEAAINAWRAHRPPPPPPEGPPNEIAPAIP
jgi:hypothetical protein